MSDILYMLVGGNTIYKFQLTATPSILGSCVLPNVSPTPQSPDLGYVLFYDQAHGRVIAICQNVGNSNQIISVVDASTMTLLGQSSPFSSPNTLAPTTGGTFSTYSSTVDNAGNIWCQQGPSNALLLSKIDQTTFAVTASLTMPALFPTLSNAGNMCGVSSYVDTNGVGHILVVGNNRTVSQRFITSVNATTATVEWTCAPSGAESTFEEICTADPETNTAYYCAGNSLSNPTWYLLKIVSGTITTFTFTSSFGNGVPSIPVFDPSTGFVYCLSDTGVVFVVNPSTGVLVQTVGTAFNPLLDNSISGNGGLPLTLPAPAIFNSAESGGFQTFGMSEWYAFPAPPSPAPFSPVILTLFQNLVASQTFNLTTALPALTSQNRGSFVVVRGTTPPPPPISLTTSVLTNVDTWELDNATSNPLDTGTPIAWYENTLDQQEFGIAPVPNTNGTIGFLYVQLATALTGLGVNLVVPDDWAPYVMWGALAELLSSDGPSFDPVRAAYCSRRYEEGVELARLVLGGSQ